MENIRQSTQGLGATLVGFAVLVLMLLGLSGTLYKLLAPGPLPPIAGRFFIPQSAP